MDQTATVTPKDLAGAVLSIDLSAVQKNWRYLNSHAGSAECGAAVKGNAYGLGVEPVGRALWEAGCRSFFVARPKEGEELRGVLPEAVIYVLDGLFPGQAEFYAQNNLLPALISTEEAREWAAFGRVYGRKLPCAIHVDTGINRLGFPIREYTALLAETATMEGLNVSLLMSHLACAEEATHPLTLKQRDTFKEVRAKLPGVPASLANSSGIFLGKDYAHDLVRPGIAIYGGNPTPAACQSHAGRGAARRHHPANPHRPRRRNRGLWRHLAGHPRNPHRRAGRRLQGWRAPRPEFRQHATPRRRFSSKASAAPSSAASPWT